MSKSVYVSLNLAEYEILMSKASFAEMGMYLILKKMGNFKTGQVGSFRQQKLNYEKLAQQLSRPIRNTAPAEVFDRGQARSIVARLERIGLVSEIRFEDEALKMRLPLSPIHVLDDVPPEEPKAPLAQPSKSHHDEPSNLALGPADAAFWDDDPFAINTDKNHQYDQYHHHSNTVAVIDDLTDLGEVTSPSATSRTHPHLPFEKEPKMSAGLTVEQIVDKLKKADGFRLLDHEISRAIMRSWEKMKLNASELDSVIFKMQSDGGYDLVPGELDKLIRANRNRDKSKSSRGKVSL